MKWEAFEGFDTISGDGYVVIRDEQGDEVAQVTSLDNVHLLAAAPELLEALKWIVTEGVNTKSPYTIDDFAQVASKAIAKAEGK